MRKYSAEELERHSLAWWPNEERIGDLLGYIGDAEPWQWKHVAIWEKQLQKAYAKRKELEEKEQI